MQSLELELNGRRVGVRADPGMPLLWVLRDLLSMTGTKYGCGISACGACTVLVDGEAQRSCVLPVGALAGRSVTTIEARLEDPGDPRRYRAIDVVRQAWIQVQVPQCGYCQSGMVMAAAGLLLSNPSPDDHAIDATISNICRCGTYQRVRQGIHLAAQALRESDR
ncbi:MAG: (2Fe-2S)-binding protein [Burkholderiaceae bacterium]|nr:(2Fe-2S)-binding protein [Burkholderiaceae bacterium]